MHAVGFRKFKFRFPGLIWVLVFRLWGFRKSRALGRIEGPGNVHSTPTDTQVTATAPGEAGGSLVEWLLSP